MGVWEITRIELSLAVTRDPTEKQAQMKCLRHMAHQLEARHLDFGMSYEL